MSVKHAKWLRVRKGKTRESKLAAQQSAKLENIFNQMQDGDIAAVNILVKADVQGSAEALRDSLENYLLRK